MPERGPEVTNGSMPTYSLPAFTAAPMIAAAMSFSEAPARVTSRPACMPASFARAASAICSSSSGDFTRRSSSTSPEASSSGPNSFVRRWWRLTVRNHAFWSMATRFPFQPRDARTWATAAAGFASSGYPLMSAR